MRQQLIKDAASKPQERTGPAVTTSLFLPRRYPASSFSTILNYVPSTCLIRKWIMTRWCHGVYISSLQTKQKTKQKQMHQYCPTPVLLKAIFIFGPDCKEIKLTARQCDSRHSGGINRTAQEKKKEKIDLR